MDQHKYSISIKHLFWVHSIVPLLLLVWAVDVFFLSHFLQPYLQLSAATVAIYLILFELPHIIGSFVSYIDTEYAFHYRRRLWLLPVMILLLCGLFWYDYLLGTLCYIFFTMYHVARQQTGITRMLLRGASTLHHVWSWLLIALYAYGMGLMLVPHVGFVSMSGLTTIFVIFFISTCIYAATMAQKSGTGWYFFVLTVLVAIVSYFFILMGYPFLALISVRFVHDITAFIFYAVHDSNRNALEAKNLIYRLLKPLHVPLIVTTPILAITLSYVMQLGLKPLQYATLIIIMLGFVHYFIESFMWKRDSLHRQYIHIR